MPDVLLPEHRLPVGQAHGLVSRWGPQLQLSWDGL